MNYEHVKGSGSGILETLSQYEWIRILSLSLMLRPTVSRPVCFGIEHPCGAHHKIFITVTQLRVCWRWSCLWREDGSIVYNCCWSSPAQSFSGPSPVGLVTIFFCLRFETSIFVASYGSQGHGGGIQTRLHTGLIHSLHGFLYRLPVAMENVGCHWNVITEPLASNELPLWIHYSGFQASCHSILIFNILENVRGDKFCSKWLGVAVPPPLVFLRFSLLITAGAEQHDWNFLCLSSVPPDKFRKISRISHDYLLPNRDYIVTCMNYYW
jgi:hypothetical protein